MLTSASLAPGPHAQVHDKADIVFQDLLLPTDEEDEDDGDGPAYKYYRSEKILGQLYDAVDETKIWHEDIHQLVKQEGDSFWDSFIAWAYSRCEELKVEPRNFNLRRFVDIVSEIRTA